MDNFPSAFPPGAKFFDWNGVPVFCDGLCCTSWPSGAIVSHAQLKVDGAVALTEAAFIDACRHDTTKVPSNYPPGTTFWEVEGVAVVMDELGLCTTSDGSFCSKSMVNEFGAPLSEAEFRLLVHKAEAAAESVRHLFPAGSSFWDLAGVPVVMGPTGEAKALDGSPTSLDMLNDFGVPLTEAEFASLTRRASAAARPLPQAFPHGSSFWLVRAVPVVLDPHGFCKAVDGSFVSSETLGRVGKSISEDEFRSLVSAFKERT